MKKEADMRHYACDQMSRLLTRMAFEVRRTARSPDPDAVHDLRVSIRRYNQGLRVFAQFFPPGKVKKIRRSARRILKAAGRVRNWDIALDLFEAAGVPRDTAQLALFVEQRAQAEKELLEVLRVWAQRDQSRRWRTALGLAGS